MLQELRDKAKSLVSYALLVLLVLSFGVWGIGDIFRGQSGKDWVAKVGSVKISPLLLLREFQNETAQLRALLGPDFNAAKARELGLLDRALQRLITTTALNLEVNKLGLAISRTQIVRTLEASPQLRNKDGSFNRQLFEQLIKDQGMTEATFIDAQKQILARNMLVRGLGMAITVPDVVADDLAAAQSQKRVAELVRVSPDTFTMPEPTQEELQKFYEDNKNAYQSTETRSFQALTLTPADLSSDIGVSEENLKKAYDEHKGQFDKPERRDITQIVAADEEKAKSILATARKSSLNDAAKAEGTEVVSLDALSRTEVPPEFATVAFAAKTGEIGGPVKTGLGWHVFTVTKITPGKSLSFEEAKKDIRAQLQSDHAAETMVQTANKVDDMLAGGKKLEEIASSLGLKTTLYENRMRSGQDAAKGSAEKMPFADDILRAAFQYKEGELSPIIESKEGGYVVVEITKVMPAQAQEFAAVEARVKEDWHSRMKGKKASELAQNIANELKQGKPLGTAAGVRVTTSAPIAMDDQKQKDVPREALAPLFNMKKGDAAVVATREGDIVVRVKDIIPASASDISARRAALKTRMAQEWSGMHIDELTHALGDFYPVEVDEGTLKGMVSEDNG